MSNEINTSAVAAAPTVAELVAAVGTRTLGNRRILQAEARINKAEEQIKLDKELIEALNARIETLPVEAGSITANVDDKVTFKTGRAETAREETGVVKLVDGNKYKVLVGKGFSQEFKTIFGGQITAVEAAEQPAAEEQWPASDDQLGL